MITIPGRLAVETRHGRYGDFNVGQLLTDIGQFAVKDPALEQFAPGKYDGEFNIVEIRPQTYQTNGRIVFEMRAYLNGITLSNIDELTRDEAQKLATQEPDPIEQETQGAPKTEAPIADPSLSVAPPIAEPAQTTAPRVSAPIDTAPPQSDADAADVQLFGPLWPLTARFKLDTTIDRRLIRQQCARLDALDYDFDPRTQEWFREAA